MLYLVLFLVAAALAGVVAALITAESLWAWISIGLSVLAGVLLLIDWLRRRPRRKGPVETAESESDEGTESAEVTEEITAAELGTGTEEASESEQGTEVLEAATGPSDGRASVDEEPDLVETGETAPADESAGAARTETVSSEHGPVGEETAGEVRPVEQGTTDTAESGVGSSLEDAGSAATIETPPGEEDTDAADILVVAELDSEVLVVDEYPRYHLKACDWLTGRDTVPIAVSEARDLGFTPCARCGPDASLAAKHRKKRGRFRSRAGRGSSRAEG